MRYICICKYLKLFMAGQLLIGCVSASLFFLSSCFLFANNTVDIFTIACVKDIPFQSLESTLQIDKVTELLKAIEKKINVKFEFTFMSLETALTLALNHQIDGILPIVSSIDNGDIHNELYENHLYFPEKYMSLEKNIIFARAEQRKEINKIEDLKDQVIGVVEDILYGNGFDEYTEVIRDFSEDHNIMIRKFANNRLSMFVANESYGHQLLENYGFPNFKTMPYIVNEYGLYLGIVKGRPNTETLLEKINQAMTHFEE